MYQIFLLNCIARTTDPPREKDLATDLFGKKFIERLVLV